MIVVIFCYNDDSVKFPREPTNRKKKPWTRFTGTTFWTSSTMKIPHLNSYILHFTENQQKFSFCWIKTKRKKFKKLWLPSNMQKFKWNYSLSLPAVKTIFLKTLELYTARIFVVCIIRFGLFVVLHCSQTVINHITKLIQMLEHEKKKQHRKIYEKIANTRNTMNTWNMICFWQIGRFKICNWCSLLLFGYTEGLVIFYRIYNETPNTATVLTAM